MSFSLPPAPTVPLIDGMPNAVSVPWYRFFAGLFDSVGSGQAPLSLGDIATAFVAQRLKVTVPSWLGVAGSPLGGESGISGTLAIRSAVIGANQVIASPNGANGAVSPRALVGADLPNPTATTLGGVKSLAAVATKFITSISTAGQPVAVQPAFSDISGSVAGSQSSVGVSTNSNAQAGYPGEYVSSTIAVGSAVSLTSGVTANVTAISLSAGDWDVSGIVATNPAGTTTTSDVWAAVSTVSATLPTLSDSEALAHSGAPISAGNDTMLPTGICRLSLAVTTTVFLVTKADFAVSTEGAYGFIRARRSANVF